MRDWFLASLLPFGPFLVDKKLKLDESAEVAKGE
jgi:hypothetical protein